MADHLDVIIIGGGIGGLCLAQALRAADVRVAVYERNATPTDWLQGYRIHINPVGCRALHACLPPIVWEAFLATAGQPSLGIGFLTEQLQELVVVADAIMSDAAPDAVSAHRPTSRIVLRRLLLAGLDDIVQFDKTFTRYEQHNNGTVTAHFADGSSATGTVLVGADGANSRVRQQVLPQAQRVETEAMGVGGKLPLTAETRAWLPRRLATRMNVIMPARRYFFFNAVFDRAADSDDVLHPLAARLAAVGLNPTTLLDGADNYVLWAFVAHRDAFPAGARDLDGAAIQHLVARMIDTWHPDLHRLVVEADPASIQLMPIKTSVPIASWASTNVTLLGDAIHNMPPLAGLGANMALRDARSLAQTLTAIDRGQAPLLPAIHAYEAAMIEHGFAAVQASMGYTQQAISSNRLARQAARTWFRACHFIPPLKRMTLEQDWLAQMHDK